MSNKPKLLTYVCGDNTFVIPERYQLTGIVGGGAYGVVASAYDTIAKKKVAVKKIPNVFTHGEEYQKRMLREILLMNHFRGHENIVCLTDLGMPESFEKFKDIYIFMEFMDYDLRNVVKSKQQFTDVNIQYFIYQILRGMKFIHSADVLHRDMKPGNVLVTNDYDVKICDFGLARGIDFSKQNPKMSTTYVATRWYRAPELLLMWDNTTKAIDMWSVGCILAELLDQPNPRRLPLFPGRNYLHQVRLICEYWGTPKEEEMRGCRSGKNYIKSLPKKKWGLVSKKLKRRYHKANPLALDLLEKLLQFDPLKRINVEKALSHPYLEQMHDLKEEPICEKKFDFYYEEEKKKHQGVSIKQMMHNFITSWNFNVHGYDPKEGATLDRKKIIHVEDNKKKKKKNKKK